MASFEYEQIEEENGEMEELFIKYFSNISGNKFIKAGKNKVVLPYSYLNFAQDIKNMEIRNDDIWVVSFPRTVTYQPFWYHVLEFWRRRQDENILFLKYEDMKKDLSSVVRSVASFLKKDLTEDQVVSLVDHLSFENMRNNPAVNNEKYMEQRKRLKNIENSGHFLRSGQVGGWKQEMSKEMAEKFDEWTKENLKNTGLVLEEIKNNVPNK